ncbi:MAG: leucyl/phenylalanyl-tRNA--protein transferase [Zoogloeaceae bacterium]|jgi:leucyl/phenylalanyl-tRNA--protein transferase|nr:leucyl/phenylalanyl-tRNA--protein transferase [Zoogloeaceae bacterium]
MIPWLQGNAPFPPLSQALREPNGLLAAGNDLSLPRLLQAYRQGIFPWFSAGEPVLWWSPDPRMALFPAEFRLHRSLLKTLRGGGYEVRLDTAFSQVINACAQTPRPGQDGTWITDDIAAAYRALHDAGWAHSVETWMDGELVGGLYGVAIGRMFYGESMFTRRRDASKIAFAHLARFLRAREFGLIDCQMNTAHLASLGAREISRAEFIARLENLTMAAKPAFWRADAAAQPWGNP